MLIIKRLAEVAIGTNHVYRIIVTTLLIGSVIGKIFRRK